MNWLARVKSVLCRFTVLTEFCHDCGRRQPVVWTADDGLWARIAGGPDAPPLCPECFDRRATRLGVLLRWVPVNESERIGGQRGRQW